MAEQMQRAAELYDFPFSFTHQTTRLLEAEETTYCSLLESWGLHGAGLWKASCDCFQMAASLGATPDNGLWNLPASYCPCEAPEDPPPGQLQSWEEFYNWRGIPFDSPVALILHWPLSLYHAFCLAQLQTLTLNTKPRQTVHIHYLGPERELDQLPAFAELLALLPWVGKIHIDFVGPAVQGLRDGESLEISTFGRCSDVECACKERKDSVPKGGITMKLWRGFYHDRHPEIGATPDLIFAANAGIAAFPGWHPTIQLIESLNVPALFTDYCEEAAVMAVQTIQYLSLGKHPSLAFPVQVNQFRQPLSPSNKDLDLPTFSNAFIFGINGPSNAS